MKRQREFFAADAMTWRAGQQPGTEEKVLSRDACPTAPTARLPAAPCSKSGTASPRDELGAGPQPGCQDQGDRDGGRGHHGHRRPR